jgi:hypothetical protein
MARLVIRKADAPNHSGEQDLDPEIGFSLPSPHDFLLSSEDPDAVPGL